MKTLKYIDGNLLLNKEVEVIGHQANCQNTFGSGIARSIREMYPEAYAADTFAAKAGLNRLGSYSVSSVSEDSRKKHGTNIQAIYNLYGQNLGTQFKERGGRMTDYDALYSALEAMANRLRTDHHNRPYSYAQVDEKRPEPVVGFPFLMGSALGGGNWNVVSRLIEVAFDGYRSDVLIIRLK